MLNNLHHIQKFAYHFMLVTSLELTFQATIFDKLNANETNLKVLLFLIHQTNLIIREHRHLDKTYS